LLRYSLFASLYFAQGAIFSYYTALNALYLRSFDLSMSKIGLVGGLAMIPFVLKIFLGMLSDRVNLFGLGYRKPYILIGIVIQTVAVLAIPLIQPARQYGLFILIAFLLMSGMALYDTCTDGLALDSTPLEEQGTIQGFMVGGRALGLVLVAGVLGAVADRSWPAVFYTLAGLSLLPIPLVLLVHEAPRPEGRKFGWEAFSSFLQPSIITLGLLGALYSLVINAASQILNPFLQSQYQINYTQAGLYTAVWGLGVVAGGLTGGRLTDCIGFKRSVQGALLASLAAILALAFIFNPQAAWPLAALFGLAYGYYETVYFALAMRLTDLRIAATMFAILMAIANLGTAIGVGLSGVLVDTMGYRWTFILIAVLNLLALPLLPVIFRNRMQRASVAA
jgi:PAT family beta-lactamase induction signal transducer AmpG